MRNLVTLTAVAVAILLIWTYANKASTPRLGAGVVQANGRIEVERIDISTKIAGRVAEIRVREGDYVEKGAVVVRMDTAEMAAQLSFARATVRRAEQVIGKAKAELGIREAELNLHEVVLKRALRLSRGVMSQAEIDKRTAERDVAQAAVVGARASIADAEAAREAAEAQVRQIEVNIEDMTLTAPVAGRVEYRLVQPGEVVSPGGRTVTLLDTSDVFMTIFLPTMDVGRVAYGSPARIVLDAAAQFVIPATVSFVAGEAQFTPKYVETRNEREKLMYRLKLKIDTKLLETYREYVRAGLTGTAYVKTDPAVEFPDWLRPNIPELPARAPNAS